MNERQFVEVGSFQSIKHSGMVCGDTFSTKSVHEEKRFICALSDGLGSGIKARVLSAMTSTMAINYAVANIDLVKAADIIMKTLPVCAERRISYSTFTLIDIKEEKEVSIVEYDNPPFLLFRGLEIFATDTTEFSLPTTGNRTAILHASKFIPQLNDRIIFFTDGVTQSGMGRNSTPFGWGHKAVSEFIRDIITKDPEISASNLAREIVQKAGRLDGLCPGDDTSCSVICFRNPRRLLIVTGPPFDELKDIEIARKVAEYQGNVIISGGTTAQIIGRLLGREITVDLGAMRSNLPPPARMDGVSMITEGTITVSRVANMLESGELNDFSPAGAMIKYMLESDVIEFLVGTRINQAHQNPALPVELDIRRNIVRRIRELLESRYCKETSVAYI